LSSAESIPAVLEVTSFMSRFLVPRLEKLQVALELGLVDVHLVVGHPDVLEGVEVALGDALEQQAEFQRTLDLDRVVVHLSLEDHLRQVGDGDVLGPPDVPEAQGLATAGRARTAAPATRQPQ
jgi:hypothetical protein